MSGDDDATIMQADFVTTDDSGCVVSSSSHTITGNVGLAIQAHTITGSITVGGITIGGEQD